jgi:hypothetical protein
VPHLKPYGDELRALARQTLRLKGVDSTGEGANAIAPALQQRMRDATALLAQRADNGNKWFAIL